MTSSFVQHDKFCYGGGRNVKNIPEILQKNKQSVPAKCDCKPSSLKLQISFVRRNSTCCRCHYCFGVVITVLHDTWPMWFAGAFFGETSWRMCFACRDPRMWKQRFGCHIVLRRSIPRHVGISASHPPMPWNLDIEMIWFWKVCTKLNRIESNLYRSEEVGVVN